jgi:hypothetical protein
LDEAAKNFQAFLQTHPNDAKSHLNLTTIFAKQKNWGMAWAHFRKAQALDPHLAGLSALKDILEENFSPPGLSGPFYRWGRPFLAALPPALLLFILLISVTALGHLLITHLKKRKWARDAEEPAPSLSGVFWVATVFCVLSCVFLLGQMRLRSETFAVVAQAQASLFSAPGENGFEVGTLSAGTELKVLRSQQAWVQVTNESGTSGWIAADSILTYSGVPR